MRRLLLALLLVAAPVAAHAIPAAYVPFAQLPLNGGVSFTDVWADGSPRICKDRAAGSNGELFGFAIPYSGWLSLYKSTNLGDSWQWVAGTPQVLAGAGQYGKTGVLSAVQDANGKVHLAVRNGQSSPVTYYRLAMARTAGAITGFSVEAGPITLPGQVVYTDFRVELQTVLNGSGTEVLVIAFSDDRSGGGFRGQFMRTTTLAPAATSDFLGLDGTTTPTLLVSDTNGWAHDHTINIAQIGSTRDLYLFYGNTLAEQGTDYTIGIETIKLTVSGTTWTMGTLTMTLSEDNFLFAARGTQNYAWVMYLDKAGGVRFGRFDSSGTFHANVIPSPTGVGSGSTWGTGVFAVNPDETRIYSIYTWNNDAASWPYTPYASFWNGSSWTTYGPGTDLGDSWGSSSSAAWDEGVVSAVPVDHIGDLEQGDVWISTLRGGGDPGAAGHAPRRRRRGSFTTSPPGASTYVSVPGTATVAGASSTAAAGTTTSSGAATRTVAGASASAVAGVVTSSGGSSSPGTATVTGASASAAAGALGGGGVTTPSLLAGFPKATSLGYAASTYDVASISAPAGTLLVAMFLGDADSSTALNSAPTWQVGSGPAFTQVAVETSGGGYLMNAGVWTATVAGTAPSSATLRLSTSSGSLGTFLVYAFSGAGTPIVTSVGAASGRATANTTSAATSYNIFGFSMTAGSGGTPWYALSGATKDAEYADSGDGEGEVWGHATGSSSYAVTEANWNNNANGWTGFGVEVPGTAGGAGSTGAANSTVAGAVASAVAGVVTSTGGGAAGTATVVGATATAAAGSATSSGAATRTVAGASASAGAGSATSSGAAARTVSGATAAAAAGAVASSGSASAAPLGATSSATAGAATSSGSASSTVTGASASAVAGVATSSGGSSVPGTATVVGATATAAAGAATSSGGGAASPSGASATAAAGSATSSGAAASAVASASAAAAAGATSSTGSAAATVSGASASARAGVVTSSGGSGGTPGTATVSGATATATAGVVTSSGGVLQPARYILRVALAEPLLALYLRAPALAVTLTPRLLAVYLLTPVVPVTLAEPVLRLWSSP